MGSGRMRSAVALAGMFLLIGASACGGGDDESTSTTTTTSAGGGARTVGNCTIQPNTSCVGANLAAANLSNANLTGANLSGANITGADLSGATLSNANLSGANLTAAVLTNATLNSTNLTGANLTQANFRGATISNLSEGGAIQCETIRNDGTVNNSSCPPPSTVTTSATTIAPLNLPCQGQPGLFLAVYQSQADNFGLSASVISSATTQGDPACASDGWATQRLQDSAGQRVAVFQATSGGWQLESVTGCQGTNVPQRDQTGLC